MNCITFTGNIGKDAEVRSTQSVNVCNFSVAVKQGFKGNTTEWYRCSIWGARGDSLAQYLTKGAKVAVTGEFEIGEYDGKAQYNVQVLSIDPFCSGKSDAPRGNGGPSQRQAPRQHDAQSFDSDLDDSVPFLSCDPRHEHRVR
jgi:single-strand DNA-binding protein